jgi:hypothetical protein
VGKILLPGIDFPYIPHEELEVTPTKSDKDVGWFIQETVGMAVVNPNAILHMAVCCICGTREKVMEVDINLKPCNGEENSYAICPKCSRKTRIRFRELKKMNPKELPLHIGDPNIFIRTRTSNLLQGIK